MEQASPRRNRLTPWYIGVAIVIVSVFYTGYKMFAGNCPEPEVLDFGVLIVIPFVYLVLMYLTFTSQK